MSANKYNKEQAREELEIELANLYADAIKNGEEISSKLCLKLAEKEGLTKIEIKGKEIGSTEIIGADVTEPVCAIVTFKGFEFTIDNDLHITDVIMAGEIRKFRVTINKGEHVESFTVSINGEEAKEYTENYSQKIEKGAEVTITAKPENGYSVTEGSGSFKVNDNTIREIKTEKVYNFDYTGAVQEWTVPATGTYKIEVWGAEGGSYSSKYCGGYGGYSVGEVKLLNGTKLYINVGGKGELASAGAKKGGYNGGGNNSGPSGWGKGASGGGATHIALSSGKLQDLKGKIKDILIVAGGGAGSGKEETWYGYYIGGHGGGFSGTMGSASRGDVHNPGTQVAGYQFGLGESCRLMGWSWRWRILWRRMCKWRFWIYRWS